MSSTALNLSKDRGRVVLSLTPLIDVVFILLVFFMLVSQFATWRQIEVHPQAALGNQTSDLSPLIITVDANGTIMINGQLAQDAPDTAARAIEILSDGQAVVIRPLEGTTIQPVINIIEALTEADVKGVRVDTHGARP